MDYKKGKSFEIKSDSKKIFFFVHGYTGSPSDFGGLPMYLHERYGAGISVPLLLGHGTNVRDLDRVFYRDFWKHISGEFENVLAEGKTPVVIGFSFGAEIALRLAAEYDVRGVILISSVHRLKFPWRLPGLTLLRFYKKYWRKKIGPAERELRKRAFYYEDMHGNALKVCRDATVALRGKLRGVRAPVLSVYSKHENVSDPKGVYDIEKHISSSVRERILVDTPFHSPIYTPQSEGLFQAIAGFVEKKYLLEKTDEVIDSASAVIPAFNEGDRIGAVLESLMRVSEICEIIVVDDGSTDGTEEAVKRFPAVWYLKNEVNKGKAYSMDRGVRAARSNIIFFCDADLKGFTPAIAQAILEPVLSGKTDMSIGIRKNRMQRAFKLFAVNSGERALHKRVWEQLPDFYKYGFRIEAGLNYFVKKYGKGYTALQFDYYQTLKEVKYGFRKGTIRRWKMNVDVGIAYCACLFMPLLFRNRKAHASPDPTVLEIPYFEIPSKDEL